MKVLVHAVHYPVASGRYILEALKNLGHDAHSYGPSTGRAIWGKEWEQVDPWLEDMPAHWEPDLVIVADSDGGILDASKRWAKNCPVVVYGVDNHVRFYRRPWISHYFVGHRATSIHKFASDTTWLPCATSSAYTESPIPFIERKYDVAFIGVPYPQRADAVAELVTSGKATVFAGIGLFGEYYARAYHDARISLCLSAKGDLAQRVFETAALGCVVLSDEVEDLNQLGRGPVLTWDGNDLPGRVEEILAMPDLGERVKSTVAWAKPHTWEERLKMLLSEVHYVP